MMLSRRGCVIGLTVAGFLPSALRAQGDAGAFLRALKALDGRTPGDIAADESFWDLVRSHFELVPENANFVTAVRGVAPKSTRERVAAEYERLNAYRLGGTPNSERKAASRR
jgi:hypothetical protein